MIVENFISLSRTAKRLIVILNDYLIILFSVFFSTSFSSENLGTLELVLSLPILTIIIFTISNIYDNVIKHINFESIIRINLILLIVHIFFW